MTQHHQAKIIKNQEIAKDLYKISFNIPEIAETAKPGQFVHIKIPADSSLLLRRPISINGVNRQTGQLDLVYQKVGKGTEIISKAQPGTKLDILGPLGKGFWIPKGIKKVYVVGGGCGVAPVKFAAQEWRHLDITSFLGFRNRASSYQIEDFTSLSSRVLISTDDGSLGQKGSIITLLNDSILEQKPDLILACGPIPMLKAMQQTAEHFDIPCQISLEERMGCGVGGCLVCSCAIGHKDDWEYKKVCMDGPVFWSKEVMLDEPFESKC